jgi:hypothetical protein
MSASILKNKINKAVEGINDETFLKAIFTIINEHAKNAENGIYLDDEDWSIVEERSKAYETGNAKTVTISASNVKWSARTLEIKSN